MVFTISVRHFHFNLQFFFQKNVFYRISLEYCVQIWEEVCRNKPQKYQIYLKAYAHRQEPTQLGQLLNWDSYTCNKQHFTV